QGSEQGNDPAQPCHSGILLVERADEWVVHLPAAGRSGELSRSHPRARALRSTYQTQQTCATVRADGRRPRLPGVQCTFYASRIAKMVAGSQSGLRDCPAGGDRPAVRARSGQARPGATVAPPGLAAGCRNPLSPGTGILGLVLVSVVVPARSTASGSSSGAG